MSCWLQHKVCDILHPLNQSTWSISTQKSFKIKACSKEALENDLNRTNTCGLSHVRLFVTHRLQSAVLLCLWDFPGKNAGVCCHFLLQGILPTQGQTCISCTGRQVLYHRATREPHTVQQCYVYSRFCATVAMVHHLNSSILQSRNSAPMKQCPISFSPLPWQPTSYFLFLGIWPLSGISYNKWNCTVSVFFNWLFYLA